jgi:hypothetical protein
VVFARFDSLLEHEKKMSNRLLDSALSATRVVALSARSRADLDREDRPLLWRERAFVS